MSSVVIRVLKWRSGSAFFARLLHRDPINLGVADELIVVGRRCATSGLARRASSAATAATPAGTTSGSRSSRNPHRGSRRSQLDCRRELPRITSFHDSVGNTAEGQSEERRGNQRLTHRRKT